MDPEKGNNVADYPRNQGSVTASFRLLGALPKGFHFLEAGIPWRPAFGGQRRLDGAEAALKLDVGAAQGLICVDFRVTGKVDHREEQVADFAGHGVPVGPHGYFSGLFRDVTVFADPDRSKA